MIARRAKRVSLHDADVHRGDPVNHIIGRAEEQSARKHAPLPPRPQIINEAVIRYNIELRMDQLRPALAEVKKLERILAIIEE